MCRKTEEEMRKIGLQELKDLFPNSKFVPISEEEYDKAIHEMWNQAVSINVPPPTFENGNIYAVGNYVTIVLYPGLDGESWAYFKKV